MTEAPLISSQLYLNPAKVVKKAKSFRVFRVRIHECELRGCRYRVVVDGHHNLAAAKLIGVSPVFKPAGEKFTRCFRHLSTKQVEAFLINNLADSDYYFVDTGEVVRELLEPALEDEI